MFANEKQSSIAFWLHFMSPAGASDMALISADMGVNSTLLIVAQILRLVAAASVFPQIIYFLCTAVT